jgi:hypothetical protein
VSDYGVLPVSGPLYVPSSSSGINFPTCDHQAPNSCPRCDGTSDDTWEQVKADRDAEKARARRMSDPSQRAAWLASLPPSTRALVEGHPTTYADEASA